MKLLKEIVMNEHYRSMGDLERNYIEMVNKLLRQKALIQQNMMRALHQKLIEIQRVIDAQRLTESQFAAPTNELESNPLLAAFPSMFLSAIESNGTEQKATSNNAAAAQPAFVVDANSTSTTTNSAGTLLQCTPSGGTLANLPVLGNIALSAQSGPFQCSICGSRLQTQDALDFHLTMHSLTDGLLRQSTAECPNRGGNVLMGHNLGTFSVGNQANSEAKDQALPPVVTVMAALPLPPKVEGAASLVVPKREPLCTANSTVSAGDVSVADDVAENFSPKTPKTRIMDKAKPFQCPKCQRRFKQRRELNRHFINRHTPNAAKPFQCRFCSYGAATKSIVQRHEYTHSASKPYKCRLCTYQTSYRYILKKHLKKLHAADDDEAEAAIESDHSGTSPASKTGPASPHSMEGVRQKRRWQCGFCDKHFSARSLMKQHELIHDGPKDFKCELCPFETAHKRSLKRHKMIHQGARPFACNFCKKKFSAQPLLEEHLKSHLGTNQRSGAR